MEKKEYNHFPLLNTLNTSKSTSNTLISLNNQNNKKKDKKIILKETTNELNQFKKSLSKTLKLKKTIKLNPFGQITTIIDKKDLLHDEWENWANKHGNELNKKFTMEEIREIRDWFIALDKNGSGGISVDELIDPLLSAGILKSKTSVKTLINLADSDGSGEIGVDEFLDIIGKGLICDDKGIKQLKKMTKKSNNGLSTSMILSEERRRRMIECVIDDSLSRFSQVDEMYRHQQYHEQQQQHLHHLHHHHRSNSNFNSNSNSNLNDKINNKRRKGLIHLTVIDPGKLTRAHFIQQKSTNEYLNNLQKIIEENKETIANDNSIDSTKSKLINSQNLTTLDNQQINNLEIVTDLKDSNSSDNHHFDDIIIDDDDDIIEDNSLDVAYSGGKFGRIASLQRLSKVLPEEEYHKRLTLKRLNTKTDYSKYDSNKLFSTIEVQETKKHQTKIFIGGYRSSMNSFNENLDNNDSNDNNDNNDNISLESLSESLINSSNDSFQLFDKKLELQKFSSSPIPPSPSSTSLPFSPVQNIKKLPSIQELLISQNRKSSILINDSISNNFSPKNIQNNNIDNSSNMLHQVKLLHQPNHIIKSCLVKQSSINSIFSVESEDSDDSSSLTSELSYLTTDTRNSISKVINDKNNNNNNDNNNNLDSNKLTNRLLLSQSPSTIVSTSLSLSPVVSIPLNQLHHVRSNKVCTKYKKTSSLLPTTKEFEEIRSQRFYLLKKQQNKKRLSFQSQKIPS